MSQRKLTLGVSLKMYFGYRQTLDWCRQIRAEIGRRPHDALSALELFVLPSFPALAPVCELLADTPIGVGAQDLHWEDAGAFTGEVSGALLREMGCRYVEVGHAERRRDFGESDERVALKIAAALRNGLTPVLCVGEARQGRPAQTIELCLTQLEAALESALTQRLSGEVIVAYEPQWAIGGGAPAPVEETGAVCRALARRLQQLLPRHDGRVIYGGSAGPGLLTQAGPAFDGLFLGRFAHDPAAFGAILDEAAQQQERK
ncbi:triosephosphate isomerase [Affinibrenneria salicis]|uniref:Triosephosphate isomerase n=1 Tax=Affinibrenneria salicis TaxID=2590031 RepID=A0A5J5G681_9GAMM|nr:triose-phosphate isomerase family protein [Affinibrenneria salicis]KAA9002543.1 triosephosphate isomerase [Affinibrenneria salicis]KAA9003169.1 triosephosphate isomerase [Affinibrenneria salicis]